jgi:hypothetical protein
MYTANIPDENRRKLDFIQSCPADDNFYEPQDNAAKIKSVALTL